MEPTTLIYGCFGLAVLVLAFRADSFWIDKDGDHWSGNFKAS